MGALLLDRAAFMCNSFLQLFLDFNKGQVWSPNRQMQYKSLTIEKYRVKIKTAQLATKYWYYFLGPFTVTNTHCTLISDRVPRLYTSVAL